MFFKPLVTLLLSVAALSSFAQKGKMPSVEGVYEQEAPNQDVLKKKYSGFTELTLGINSSNKWDTTEVFKIIYNPQGLPTDTWLYKYGEESKQNSPTQHLSQRVREATHFSYEYDGKRNRTAEKKYCILPAGSDGSYMYLFIQKAAEMQLQKKMNAHSPDEENSGGKALRAYSDSLLRVGAPVQSIFSGVRLFVYDIKNNVVYDNDSESHNSSAYVYTFYADGRVHTLHRSFISYANSNSLYRSTEELHFTFTPHGKMTTAIFYRTDGDSMKVASKENIVMDQRIHYNAAGLRDTVEFGPVQYQEGTKEVMTYNDTLLQTVTVYRILPKNASPQDTLSHTIYKYNKNGLYTEVLTISNDLQSEMRPVRDTVREEYSYNNKGVIIERKLYGTRYGQSGQLKEQHLFFYGTADDKKTQQRIIAMIAKPVKKEDPNWIDPGLIEASVPNPAPVRVPTSDTAVFMRVEQMPEFRGDINSYLKEHHKYPEDARDNGIEGKVVVRFVVRADGTIGRVEVLKGLGHGCDEEALRLIKEMPAWKPGRQNGKAVDVYFIMPVYFKME